MNDVHNNVGQWPRIARNWNRIGSPLRPVAEDIAFFKQAIDGWTHDHPHSNPRGLILGVTPELHALPWPNIDLVYAVDHTQAMIDHVWPGRCDKALLSNWLAIPLTRNSVDIAMCDGGLHLLSAPHAQQALAVSLAEIITPGGRLALRLFLPPDERETADSVFDDLLAGRIRDLNCLKLRLGPALMPSAEAGVALRDVWACLHDLAGPGGWPGLAKRLGWTEDHLQAIDGYRDSPARYHFLNEERALALFTSGTEATFEVIRVSRPGYAMGQSCPTVVFRRN